MGKPTGFMEYDRCEAASVEPKERIKNFNEFHVFLSKENQQKQAARCMDCGVSSLACQVRVPLNSHGRAGPLKSFRGFFADKAN